MGDFDIEEIKTAVGYDENSDSPSEEVKIIKDEKQYRIRIPKKFADIAELNPEKDTFRVVLEKPEGKDSKPDIQIFLVRG